MSLLRKCKPAGSCENKVFANRSPDRFAHYLIQIAKLAGYNERLELDLGFKPLNDLANSELRTMLRDLMIKLRHLEAIDVMPEHGEETETESAESSQIQATTTGPTSK